MTICESLRAPSLDTITPIHFGAAADGVRDDRPAVQASIDYAAIKAGGRREQRVIVDLMGRDYAVSDTLSITSPIVFQNGTLRPTVDFKPRKYLIQGDGPFSSQWFRIDNVWLEGGNIANGIRTIAPDATINNVNVRHFPDYGIRLSHRAYVNGGSVTQWEWDDPQRRVWSERTGVGISIEHGDSIIRGVTGASSRLNLYCTGYNSQILGCHFWNGGVADSPANIDVMLVDNATGTVMVGNYIDNGQLRIKDTFGHTVTGNLFIKNADGANDYAIAIESSSLDERVSGLNVVGNTFGGRFPKGVISFQGSGTYVSDAAKFVTWANNQRTGGEAAWLDMKQRNRMTISGMGKINIPGLPTSAAGLSPGDLWRDTAADGALKVV